MTNVHLDLNIVRGRPAVLNCPATGIPFPNITWYKVRSTTQINALGLLREGLRTERVGIVGSAPRREHNPSVRQKFCASGN